MSYRPKFDSLYSGNWPYASDMGVGIRLDGLPNDKKGFINYLMDHSCNPMAGERIYKRILDSGSDRLTVTSSLRFDEIAVGLRIFGVTLSIIAPLEGWARLYEDGPYPEDFIPPHLRIVKKGLTF